MAIVPLEAKRSILRASTPLYAKEGEIRGRGLCVWFVWVQDAFLLLLSAIRLYVLSRWQLEQTTSHLETSFFIISKV